MPTTTTRPNKIRQYRERAKLTQAELAKLVDLTIPSVSRHETGVKPLTDAMLAKYAAVFKVPTHKLFQ